ncbi:hypothetical protein NQ318_016104 [Aromia moschata]|uniref:Mos1 transposase HTH domain-containing protein n=1 Tax=Aromia moschata TaxID=1265417 RepID=A0AAV8XYF8_9CUCU|nr:hypothetical protein NQ318_016104 [Aromia moschata]
MERHFNHLPNALFGTGRRTIYLCLGTSVRVFMVDSGYLPDRIGEFIGNESSSTQAYAMLKDVYGNECLSRIQLFEWFKRFKEGRETTEDNPRPGRPSTLKTDENIEIIGKSIREDRRLSIRGLTEITGIDKECVRQILHESFNMRTVCAKLVPKFCSSLPSKSNQE